MFKIVGQNLCIYVKQGIYVKHLTSNFMYKADMYFCLR